MSLHIEQRENEGIVILDLKGPLRSGHGDLELRDRLSALHQSGKVNIILNNIKPQGRQRDRQHWTGDVGIWTRQASQGRWKAGAGKRQSVASGTFLTD
jgi:hypothetical protein